MSICEASEYRDEQRKAEHGGGEGGQGGLFSALVSLTMFSGVSSMALKLT
jgi:hypothetical protein